MSTRPGASRFIPARAGNTHCSVHRLVRESVHPRAGGEHVPGTGRVCVSCGSSPRGRGTPLVEPIGCTARRFIPARAGNTPTRLTAGISTPVHPRAGGEHARVSNSAPAAVGSSPRGRGTRFAQPAPVPRRRFIPARAGNTPPTEPEADRNPVHPRAGGEHRHPEHYSQIRVGSSPRGRGTRARDVAIEERRRFIPARAGNTR